MTNSSKERPTLNRIKKVFETDDAIAAVVRCHLELELSARYVLSRLSCGRCDQNEGAYRYLRDVRNGLFLLGVPICVLRPVDIINKHRNEFAHRQALELSEDQVRELFDAIVATDVAFSEDYTVLNTTFRTATNIQKYALLTLAAIALLESGTLLIKPVDDNPNIVHLIFRGER